ncbi:MAG TPA: kelch repeat-containing protein [Frankiaceae bacterium]|jgi:N-acetylneuraminic acid mutarotase|nr:kelch repeat-containing protein [Frankiaceae bacterium]
MRRVGIAVVAALAMVLPGVAGATGSRRAAPRWRQRAPMAQARTEAAYALAGDEVYVVGGFVVELTNSTSVEVYDPAKDAWREGPPIPVAVNHASAAAVGKDVYVAGGYLAIVYGATNTFLVLRDGAPAWTPLAPMPETRAAAGMVRVGGRLYVVGGFTQQGDLATTTLVYDLAAGTWSTQSAPPTPREHLTVVTDGSRYVYAAGGRDGDPSTNSATVERYDTVTRRWTRLPSLLTRRSGHVSALTSNGLLVSAGGEHATGVFDSVEAYDLRSGRRFALPPLEPGRTGFAGIARGTTFYVFSGASDAGYLDRTETLDLRGL